MGNGRAACGGRLGRVAAAAIGWATVTTQCGGQRAACGRSTEEVCGLFGAAQAAQAAGGGCGCEVSARGKGCGAANFMAAMRVRAGH